MPLIIHVLAELGDQPPFGARSCIVTDMITEKGWTGPPPEIRNKLDRIGRKVCFQVQTYTHMKYVVMRRHKLDDLGTVHAFTFSDIYIYLYVTAYVCLIFIS